MSTSSIGGSFDLAAKEAYEASRKTTNTTGTSSVKSNWREEDTPSSELSFTDMLQLMVVQFQNQTIDNTADTSDMMNQLVQMSVVQAMTGLTTKMEEVAQANILTYSASLVGKEVTVGVWDADGKLKEIPGRVTGAGTYDGQSVIFLDNKKTPYFLSSIMAVGKLPDPEDTDKTEGDDKTDPTDPVDPDKPGETTKPGETEKPGETDKPTETEKPGETDKPTEGTETPGDSTDKPVDPTDKTETSGTETGGTDAPGTDSGTDEEPMQI